MEDDDEFRSSPRVKVFACPVAVQGSPPPSRATSPRVGPGCNTRFSRSIAPFFRFKGRSTQVPGGQFPTMPLSQPATEASERTETPEFDHGRLAEAIEHAAHLLPAQGPITVFIHHNTLHAFEHLPFDEAIKKAASVFGCHPYLTEDRYRFELRRGRIRFAELQEVLEQDLAGDANLAVPCFGTRRDLRLAMLQYPLRTGPTEELVWYVAEANALRRVREEVSSAVRARLIAETRRWVMRDLRGWHDGSKDGPSRGWARQGVPESLAELLGRSRHSALENWSDDDWESFTLQALWRVCCDGVRHLPAFTPPPAMAIRHRDLLLEATGEDADAPVHDLLIRFCASFLDQGLAHWPLPGRDAGFYRAFCDLYRQPGGSPARWMDGLERELARLAEQRISPLDSVRESLRVLGVPASEWDAFLSTTLLALRGWGGMVRQIENRGDRAVQPVASGSLVEFVAVRLLLDRFSLAHAALEALDHDGPLDALRGTLRARLVSHWPPSVEQRAFPLFQLAQVHGLSPDVLHRLDPADWSRLIGEIEGFSAIERRRVFHVAYERRFANQTLDAFALHAPKAPQRREPARWQVVTCLDEREESFRRHMEELDPGVETFGAAGFFAMVMYYRGAADAHFVPLCPVVVRPQHWVVEEVGEELDRSHRRRAFTRRALGTASHQFHVGSRTLGLGALLTGALGVLASFPLVARILFPRLTARIRHGLGRIVRTPPATRLRLERAYPMPGPDPGQVGFNVAEMTDAAERLLRDIGLTSGFAPLVVLLGHGSDSQNNPYVSAYNCGACGGSPGGPNARALAQVLNDPRIRQGLADRGLALPAETSFVGGYHNTCTDSVTYADLDRLPEARRNEFADVRRVVESALDRNAHERCRRFMSAPLTLSFAAARQHVEERAEDLAQTRPELGHATNAIVVVGRREWSRGLFLDRRAFLTSYDPSRDDPHHSILTRILQAAVPVCAGINLEYFFSHVDNQGFGSGTKLPHNLASLLGVMDGAASDLRTGLPWQMVEIHEPVRALFVIETTPDALFQIMAAQPMIDQTIRNGWIQLATIDPETRAIQVFRDGQFEPYVPGVSVLPSAASSADWYRGWREHLEFAEIDRASSSPPGPERSS